MFLLLLAYAAASPTAAFPAFDTKTYCRKVGETVGGSYQIEEACRDQEAEALEKLTERAIPDRILQYCSRVGETVGGSYQIMETCVERETESAARLK